MPTLDAKIDFRCTKDQKKRFSVLGGAEFFRHILDEPIPKDEIIYQEGALVGSEDPYKLFKKVAEK